jgi:sodium/hydrogen antiporter
MAFVGGFLLLVALSSAYIRNIPITTSALYLAIGAAISPLGFGLIDLNFVSESELFEHLAEVAVIVSLFVGGLKLRLPFRDPAWKAAFRLAGPVMLVTICGIAAFCHFVFALPWPVSFVIGSVLAPTDPVLAGTVTVNDASDRDRMRYGLSGEAGFNDGAAFPFVVFGLMWLEYGRLGEWIGWWALHRLLWAVPVALLIGFFLGKWIGRLSIWLRTRHRESEAPNDLLALALIAIAYTGAEFLGAWGFLSAFAAGLGFRRAEVEIMRRYGSDLGSTSSEPSDALPDALPAEELAERTTSEKALSHPATAGGVVLADLLSFGDTAERLLEVMLVVLVGVCLAQHWDWRAVPLALATFFLIRPVAVYLFLQGTPTGRYQRTMMAWFGIRGIGSLYYLGYALNHGLSRNAGDAASITLSVVAMSIFLHGVSSRFALDLYERTLTHER